MDTDESLGPELVVAVCFFKYLKCEGSQRVSGSIELQMRTTDTNHKE